MAVGNVVATKPYSRPGASETVLLALLDSVYIGLAYLFAVYVTLRPEEALSTRVLSHAGFYVIFVFFWYWVALDRGLWNEGGNEDIGMFLFSMARAVIGAMVFSVFVTVAVADRDLEREFLSVFCLGTLATVLFFRALSEILVIVLHALGYRIRTILIVGANDRSAHLAKIIRSRRRHGYRVEGFLENDPARAADLARLHVPHLGDFALLSRVLTESPVDEVVVALPIRSCHEIIRRVTETCEAYGVRVHLLADLFPMRIARSDLHFMDEIPLLSLSAVPEAHGELLLKRAFDLLVSSLMLMALLPLFGLMALLIKLDSTGPVFFLQERIGLNGRRFKMIKFRSMIVKAEDLRAALEKQNEMDGPVFKIRNDPRVTRVGRFIRKFSIDEFPQLVNVWLGHMSLVGPRPPIQSEVVQYTWDQRRRLSVKPGMTGLWQVSGRNDVNFDEWVELDLEYIDRWSLGLDFLILFKTFGAVVKGRGAA